MAVRDLEAFVRQRAAVFDSGLDVSPGSPFDTQVIQPLVRRLGTDPFTIDLPTFLYERLNQAFPDMAIGEGDAITDILVKPVTLLWDSVVREIFRVRQGQSFRDASQLTVEEAEALGANIFAERQPGDRARGLARVYFAQPQNASITPLNYVATAGGLHFFPTENQSIRLEEMLFNLDRTLNLYYFDFNVIAEAPGVQYNIEPASLASIANLPSAVKVTNLRRFRSGQNDETAEDFINRADSELTERSLVTLRGISAKLTKAFPELRRLNVVGFNDPEMQRDIVRGGGLGEILAAGISGAVGDDGEGQAHSRRFQVPLAEANFVTLTVASDLGDYVITVFGAFDDGSVAKDLTVRKVLVNDLTNSYVDVDEQVLVLSATSNLRWSLRRKSLTLSQIPGGILFPTGALGTVEIKDDEVHIGGTTDVHVGSSSFDQATLILDSIADNSPEASGSDAIVVASGGSNVFQFGSHVLGTNYLVTDALFQTLKEAARSGMTLQILGSLNPGSYRVVSVTQTSGSPLQILTDPQPATVTALTSRWKLLDSIDIELTDPRETLVSGTDLITVQGSNIVTTASAVDFSALGVQTKYTVRISSGESVGDYTVDSVPAPTQIKLTTNVSSSGAGLKYEVFRPNLAGSVQLPLVRVTKIDVLDSSSQPVGTSIPYAKPIDIQTQAFQNPARGIKLDIRDTELGVVSLPVGVEATGTIQVVTAATLNDGETFTLNDGINAPITFEYDKNGSWAPGNVRVNIASIATVDEVATASANAINSVGTTLRIKATTSVGGFVNLTNLVPGTTGNQAITETVADIGYTVTGMAGGANGVYGISAGDTLILNFLGFEGGATTTVNVSFTVTSPTLAQVVADISAAISSALSIPNGAVLLGPTGSPDRFGIRPLKAGTMVVGGTAMSRLFIDSVHTSWDVRSNTVVEAGGWAAVLPTLDLTSGLDVLQVLDGGQIGIYGGPYTVPTADGLRIVDPTQPLSVGSARFAPEIQVHTQFGSRSLGSARVFFLEPTSVEFDQSSRFSLETSDGVLQYLPDPSLTTIRIPAPPSTTKPADGSATGGTSTFTSASQDFVRTGIRRGDQLNIFYVPLVGSVVLPNPVTAVGLTLIYSIDGQADRTLTFIQDDLSLLSTQLTRPGLVDQINASVGRKVASLDGAGHLQFVTDVSFVIRKSGTANSVILNQRNGLPAVPRYAFAQADQSNDSPHRGSYTISAVTQTTLTINGTLPSSGDFSNPVLFQSFTVERLGVQRISTTEMAANTVEPDLYYFDVQLVSLGSGDQYNIQSDLQMVVTGYRSDGYFLTTDDSNLSFSPIEKPRLVISPTILQNGVADSPSNATELSGRSIQISYDRSQLTEDVNNFLTSEVERVVNESPLGRHLVPHFVRFALRYTSGSTEDLVKQDLETYILGQAPNQAVESSDIQKIVSGRGATSIENPIDLVAIVHYPDRSVYATRSQNSLTTGRLSAFVPDVLDVKRSTA